MLKKRIITACILVPITLLVLFYLPPRAFILLTAFVTMAGAWEWAGLMGMKSNARHVAYVLVVSIMMVASLFTHGLIILFGAATWWFVAFLLVCCYPRFKLGWNKGPWCRGVMGILTLVPCWWTLNFVRVQKDGIYAIFYIFILIWLADSAAYFVGKKWGRHKLAPTVSPGKSIEGVIGALLSTLIISFIACFASSTASTVWPYAIILSMVTVLFSILGDLFESMLKREAKVKDSGNLLPGHGGLLDRIDSLTAAVPLFACGAWVIGNYL